MNIEDIIIAIVLAIVVCVPVLAVTARFTLKPIVDAIIRLRETTPGASPMLERRVLELEDEVRSLRGSMGEMAATLDFQQKLLGSVPDAAESPRESSGGS